MAGNERVIADMQQAAAPSTTAESESAAQSRRMHEASERAHALAHTPPAAPEGRAPGVKRVIRRAVQAGSPPGQQNDFNASIAEAVAAIRQLIDRFDIRLAALEANSTETWGAIRSLQNKPSEATALRASLASHDVLIDELSNSIGAVEAEMARLTEHIGESQGLSSSLGEVRESLSKMAKTIESLRGDTSVTRSHLDLLLADSRSTEPTIPGRTPDEVADRRRSELYSRFEARFRGTREQVLASLDVYSDLIDQIGAVGPVVDIGPGRGEWLSVLDSNGVEAYGVDTNSEFVESCKQRGLDVRLGDALEHLRSVAEGSLGAVTGFHIVEHLPIETLVELADLCMVSIAPGGKVLFETPNPTNLRVGAASFYLDPTHLRPLHPELLHFILADRGFTDIEVRFVHPARDLPEYPDELQREFSWSLFGPQDYAVIATRPGASTRR